jgi:hypothetical protein
MAQQITNLEKLVEAQEANDASSINRAIDDLLALVQAMLPGARRALRDGDVASAGDREDLDDLRATIADLDTMMNDSPTFQLMRDRDGA